MLPGDFVGSDLLDIGVGAFPLESVIPASTVIRHRPMAHRMSLD